MSELKQYSTSSCSKFIPLRQRRSMYIDVEKISNTLKKLHFIEFALLFGSAKDGILSTGSDIDIAIYFSKDANVDFDKISSIFKELDNCGLNAVIDICRLNTAGIILRMEAIKGNLLFAQDMTKFSEFYSLTCREYEDFIYWSSRQLNYRGIV